MTQDDVHGESGQIRSAQKLLSRAAFVCVSVVTWEIDRAGANYVDGHEW